MLYYVNPRRSADHVTQWYGVAVGHLHPGVPEPMRGAVDDEAVILRIVQEPVQSLLEPILHVIFLLLPSGPSCRSPARPVAP